MSLTQHRKSTIPQKIFLKKQQKTMSQFDVVVLNDR